MSWAAIAFLAGAAYGLKALGVVWTPPADRGRLAGLIPAALLAGLIVVMTVETEGELVVDARLPGVLAAAVAAWWKASFVVVVAIAMAVTAATRLVF